LFQGELGLGRGDVALARLPERFARHRAADRAVYRLARIHSLQPVGDAVDVYQVWVDAPQAGVVDPQPLRYTLAVAAHDQVRAPHELVDDGTRLVLREVQRQALLALH